MVKRKLPRAKPKQPVSVNDPSDFGDLGPIEAAPDDVRHVKTAEVIADDHGDSEPKEQPKPKKITLKPDDILAAILNGDASGLPMRKGFSPVLRGSEIVLAGEGSKITVALAGYAVNCELVSEVRLVGWSVQGAAVELVDRWRLMNNVKMAVGGRVIELKKNKEFFGHQINVERLKQAGGIVIPIGQK